MADYVSNMFSIPLIHLDIRNWEVKKQELLNLCSNEELEIPEKENTYTSFFRSGVKYNLDIALLFKEELDTFLKNSTLKLEVTDAWFEHSKKGMFHEPHTHGPKGYSCVCFIDYDPAVHSPTKFIAPFNNFITGEPLTFVPENIKEGSLIIFPASVLHFTYPNTSDKVRKILSFNLR